MRKNNILSPDTFVRDNVKFIRMLGKKAANVDKDGDITTLHDVKNRK